MYVLNFSSDFEYDTFPPNPLNSCVILKSYPAVGLTTEFVLSRLYEKISALLFLFPTSDLIIGVTRSELVVNFTSSLIQTVFNRKI